MEILTFITDTLDTDGRFEKALNIIRIQKNLQEEMLAIQPTAPFPTPLTLTTLPYTIMKVYSIAKKHLLFGTGQSTPVAHVMTRRQSSQKYGRTYTQQKPRQRIQAICEFCGSVAMTYVQ